MSTQHDVNTMFIDAIDNIHTSLNGHYKLIGELLYFTKELTTINEQLAAKIQKLEESSHEHK